MTAKINTLSQMVIKRTYECKYVRGFLQIHEMYLHVCESSVLQLYLQCYSTLKEFVGEHSCTLKKMTRKTFLRALEVENISRPSELNDEVDIFFLAVT